MPGKVLVRSAWRGTWPSESSTVRGLGCIGSGRGRRAGGLVWDGDGVPPLPPFPRNRPCLRSPPPPFHPLPKPRPPSPPLTPCLNCAHTGRRGGTERGETFAQSPTHLSHSALPSHAMPVDGAGGQLRLDVPGNGTLLLSRQPRSPNAIALSRGPQSQPQRPNHPRPK